ncbi:hypothetical protein DPMN_141113 [Dreissena polymorpha]|uniref:Uncharacterized protein n=1 Tax=Dreissena polymorpha TaxID=45954 RepID=A0A9D4JI00_DREPO|nr:hypothetical protein DPMN_141113 [Dreissena polymorpha]
MYWLFEGKCIKPVDEELVEMALKVAREKDPKTKQKLSKPVDELLDYACNFEKASYGIDNITFLGYYYYYNCYF